MADVKYEIKKDIVLQVLNKFCFDEMEGKLLFQIMEIQSDTETGKELVDKYAKQLILLLGGKVDDK